MDYFEVDIPSTLDIDKMLMNHPMDPKLKKDKLIYIISLIYPIASENLENWYNREWMILSSTILKKIISNYKDYLNYLIDEVKIVEPNDSYNPNLWSKGYRFTDVKYILIHPQTFKLTDKTLLKSIEKSWGDDQYGTSYVKKNIPHLYKWFNDKLELKEDNSKARAINNGLYRLSVDDFGKRLHTPLTRLRKDSRKYLRYNGQALVELDVKSSQPYLCIKIVLEQAIKEHPQLNEQLQDAQTIEQKLDIINNINDLKGLSQFILDIVTNDIYNVLKVAFENKFDFSLGERDHYKELMMIVLFTQNGYNPKGKELFAQQYPYVSEVFKKINKTDYKSLAKRLQRLESKLILRVICKEISRQNKDIPLFTIHDSVLTTLEHSKIVKQVMVEVLTDEIGFKPTIKDKDYSLDN